MMLQSGGKMTDYIFALFMYASGNWQAGVLWIIAVGLGLVDPNYYGWALIVTAIMIWIRRLWKIAEV